MLEDGTNINPGPRQLLVNAMTYKCEVQGITGFGIAKMCDSVVQHISFQNATSSTYSRMPSTIRAMPPRGVRMHHPLPVDEHRHGRFESLRRLMMGQGDL